MKLLSEYSESLSEYFMDKTMIKQTLATGYAVAVHSRKQATVFLKRSQTIVSYFSDRIVRRINPDIVKCFKSFSVFFIMKTRLNMRSF